MYGRSMRTLAATDESQTSRSRPHDDDDGGGNDVIDTDCFIGLVERVLSVIEFSMLCSFQTKNVWPEIISISIHVISGSIVVVSAYISSVLKCLYFDAREIPLDVWLF